MKQGGLVNTRKQFFLGNPLGVSRDYWGISIIVFADYIFFFKFLSLHGWYNSSNASRPVKRIVGVGGGGVKYYDEVIF